MILFIEQDYREISTFPNFVSLTILRFTLLWEPPLLFWISDGN